MSTPNKQYETPYGPIQVYQVEHHRNGVGGAPFWSILFRDVNESRDMIASVFDEPGYVAVYAIGLLAQSNITFGQNSWRGDVYEWALRCAIKDAGGAPMSKPIYTSSGIIRNADKPRVGVISLNSELLNQDIDIFGEEIINGIDLGYEEYRAELEASGKTDEEIDEEMYSYRNDESHYLFGDWIKNADGKYEINKTGKAGYAATYSSYSGNICVEFSKTARRCNNTSPCYVMADGSGPCGNLDSEGDNVLAYDLPKEFYK